MGYDQRGCPPDVTMPLQGPYGTGISGPANGKCPVGVPLGSADDDAMTRSVCTCAEAASVHAARIAQLALLASRFVLAALIAFTRCG